MPMVATIFMTGGASASQNAIRSSTSDPSSPTIARASRAATGHGRPASMRKL
jgi:hypothetical protein